ncbi:MAG: hypothetical protein LBI19_01905 [Oscillospiraceae bacterium]|nr:hypothetical protein [Oscillospiraceae bacterium]
MSNTIIKAGKTRLLPPEERPRLLKPAKADEADKPDEVIQIPDDRHDREREREEREAIIQAAYDEVIEAAQREVALLLEDARRQAREIVSETEANAEKARAAAHADGFEKGLGIGFADGVERAERALEDLLRDGQAEVDSALAAAYAERDRLLLEMEPKIYRLALDVAEKIVGLELDQDNKAFVSLVTAALNVIQCESRVTLRVNAEEHTRAFRSKAEARLKTERGSVEADIVTDMGIEPHGCLIETGNGTVDASVDAQLEQIARNMGIEQND